LGAIAENYVAQHFAAREKNLLFWRSDSKSGGQAEIDFVLQEGTDAIPVEVKAGERITSRSLSVFVKKYSPAYSIRIMLCYKRKRQSNFPLPPLPFDTGVMS
jgi:hypothetical protein